MPPKQRQARSSWGSSQGTDFMWFVRTNRDEAPSESPVVGVLQVGLGTMVCLDAWTPLCASWEDMIAFVSEEGGVWFSSSASGSFEIRARDLGYSVAGLACSSEALFMRTSEGRVLFWLAPEPGVAPSKTFFTHKTPTPVAFTTEVKDDVIQIAAGGRHQLALMKGGQVFAWGRNHKGQLGLGKTSQHTHEPTLITALVGQEVIAVACGLGHSAALTKAGQLFTWGWGSFGQLGLGHTRDMSEPTAVSSLTNILDVVLGGSHTLVRTEGCVWACGNNQSGQLGIVVSPSTEVKNPVRIVPDTSSTFLPLHWLDASMVDMLACGAHHSGAVVNSQLALWGMKNGTRTAPHLDSRLRGGYVACLALGSFFTCAIFTKEPPFRTPRISGVLQKLVEDSNEGEQRNCRRVLVHLLPRDTPTTVPLWLPLELLQYRAPRLYEQVTDSVDAPPPLFGGPPASLGPPEIDCGNVEGFLSMIHYLCWATCPFHSRSACEAVLDLALRFGLTPLSEAATQYLDQLQAEEAKTIVPPTPVHKSQARSTDPINFKGLLAEIKAKNDAKKAAAVAQLVPVIAGTVLNQLSTLDAGWHWRQASTSLQIFRVDARKWMVARGDVSVLCESQSISFLSLFMPDSFKPADAKEPTLVPDVNARILELFRRFSYGDDLPRGVDSAVRAPDWVPTYEEMTVASAQARAWGFLEEARDLQTFVASRFNTMYTTAIFCAAHKHKVEPLRTLAAQFLRESFDHIRIEDKALLSPEQLKEVKPGNQVPAGCCLQ